jgi:cysteinyl-tRNA synthetase
MHNGMLELDEAKMSKSLGNIVTLRNVLDTWGRETLLLYLMSGHYRQPIAFHDEALDAARGRGDRFREVFRNPSVAAPPGEWERLAAALDDDFNTPAAMGALFEAVRRGNLAIDAGEAAEARRLVATVRTLTGALGLELDDGSQADGDDEVAALVAARDTARRARDFAEADRIRAELAGRGITLEDTASGTVWRR